MKNVLAVRLLALALALTVSAAAAPVAQESTEPRPMTTDDALDMTSVSPQALSPDGEWVIYTKRALDWDENEYDSEVWIARTDGSETFRYLGEDGGSDFRFSPDGRYLTFKRSSGEGRRRTSQLYWMRTSGGEATQLTEHATSIGQYRWSADSSRIFFASQDERNKDEQKAIDDGDDAIFVDEGPNGQNRSQWSNLWVFTIEPEEGEEQYEQLTDEEFLVGGFDPSPDGRWVALTARYTNRRNDGDKTEIFLLDVESGEKTRLTENRAPRRRRAVGTGFEELRVLRR